jgi:hypothetical protein
MQQYVIFIEWHLKIDGFTVPSRCPSCILVTSCILQLTSNARETILISHQYHKIHFMFGCIYPLLPPFYWTASFTFLLLMSFFYHLIIEEFPLHFYYFRASFTVTRIIQSLYYAPAGRLYLYEFLYCIQHYIIWSLHWTLFTNTLAPPILCRNTHKS